MTPRLSAEERRDEIIAAAAIEFAQAGYAGTPTESIARRVGVSQPYLFQLFGTKRELFIGAIGTCFDRTRQTFEDAGKPARAAGLSPHAILEEIGHAYIRLLQSEPNVLRLQLQAYAAAASDTEIRDAVRQNYTRLWQTVSDLSGADGKKIVEWFAMGMLINVIASIGQGTSLEELVVSMVGGAPHHA